MLRSRALVEYIDEESTQRGNHVYSKVYHIGEVIHEMKKIGSNKMRTWKQKEPCNDT